MSSGLRKATLLDRFRAVRRHRHDGVPTANKPLTIAWAIDRIERGKPRLTSYADAEQELRPLLDAFARPGTLASHAFWRLQNDLSFWEVIYDGPAGKDGKEPALTNLRARAVAGFTKPVYEELAADPKLRRQAFSSVLDTCLRSGLRITTDDGGTKPVRKRQTVERIIRGAAFRSDVMDAYDHICVVCEYGVRVRGLSVGLEAAHVRPLRNHGPDRVDNGIALCTLHHRLFDAGALAYGPDRRLIVSQAVRDETGNLPALQTFAGRLLPEPATNAWRVRNAHLAWHRDHVFVEAADSSNETPASPSQTGVAAQ